MGFLKMKKKLIRAYQTLKNISIADTPVLPVGYRKRTLIRHFKNVRPAERLAYYEAFRLFLREVKFEYEYADEVSDYGRAQVVLDVIPVPGDDSANN